VSKLVEDYFRLGIERPGEESESSTADAPMKTDFDPDPGSSRNFMTIKLSRWQVDAGTGTACR